MAQAGNYEIVRKNYSVLFDLRICLSSRPADGPFVHTDAIVDGCKCTATLWPRISRRNFKVVLVAQHVVEGAAMVYTHMVLLDKSGSPVPSSMAKGPPGHTYYLYLLSARRDYIKANCLVDNNYFVVQCSLRVHWITPAALSSSSSSSVEHNNKLPDLGHDLTMMYDRQELTDVSFDVGGESFGAHRLVLATRSPVFRAELYGPMAESNMKVITIQDMEASTFRSLLYYMYHGSLSDDAVGRMDAFGSCTMAQYQHLLVAADRYRVEELKKTCEDKLCGIAITVDNVFSMLELAEEHACSQIKIRCFDFLADGDNFKMVATSGEYLRLMQSFPTLLAEMQNSFKAVVMDHRADKKRRVCVDVVMDW